MEDAIRISELSDIRDYELTSIDELVINDVNKTAAGDDDIVTKKTTIASFIDFFTSQDLNFTGNINLQGTIQPPPGEELDIIVNDLTVKGDLTLEPTAEVYGLLLTKHLSDVQVSRAGLEAADSLFWDPATNDKDGFRGAFVARPGVIDAPKDGDVYVRKDGQWVKGVEEPPCDDGYYVRRCKDGEHYWEDISDLLFPPVGVAQIVGENCLSIGTEKGEEIFIDGEGNPQGCVDDRPTPQLVSENCEFIRTTNGTIITIDGQGNPQGCEPQPDPPTPNPDPIPGDVINYKLIDKRGRTIGTEGNRVITTEDVEIT